MAKAENDLYIAKIQWGDASIAPLRYILIRLFQKTKAPMCKSTGAFWQYTLKKSIFFIHSNVL